MYISVDFHEDSEQIILSSKELQYKIVPSYPYNHIIVNIAEMSEKLDKTLANKAVKTVIFECAFLRNTTQIGIEIVDKGLYSRRMIMDNMIYFTGDKIKVESGNFIIYSVNLEQDGKLENLPQSTCKNYEQPENYSSCDNQFIKEAILEDGWGDIMPIFAVDISNVTDDLALKVVNYTKSYDIMRGVTKGSVQKKKSVRVRPCPNLRPPPPGSLDAY